MRSLFHYQPYVSQHLRGLLDEGRIRLSSPASFNDPWDCKVHYAVPKPGTPDAKRLWKWLLDMDRKWSPARSAADREVMVASIMIDHARLEGYLLEASRQMTLAVAEKYRVYCLTEEPRSTLMWSHYAKSHTGLCIEFDAEAYPMKHADFVRYESHYPAYDLATTNEQPLLTKSIDWAYEREWRLVAEERSAPHTWPETIKVDDGFLNVGAGVVKSITVGALATSEVRTEVASMVESLSPHVLIRQAVISPDRYELVVTPDFDPK